MNAKITMMSLLIKSDIALLSYACWNAFVEEN